jgi:hypothetical protein
MEIIWTWSVPVMQNLLSSLIAVIAGIIFTQFIRNRYDKWKYGRWHVVVTQSVPPSEQPATGATATASPTATPLTAPRQVLVDRAISVRKAKEILTETSDLSVFLKGVISPYAYVKCDLVGDDCEKGLLEKDDAHRVFRVDLDHNRHASEPANAKAAPQSQKPAVM